jgi:hypothetical protein
MCKMYGLRAIEDTPMWRDGAFWRYDMAFVAASNARHARELIREHATDLTAAEKRLWMDSKLVECKRVGRTNSFPRVLTMLPPE